MPLDVLDKLNEAKQNVSSDEQLTNNLDAIIEKAKSSSEAMNALTGIVNGLTSGGNSLSDCLDKVCFYFDKFEERSNAAKVSAFGLGDAYNQLGKNAPSHFGKIISSLEEIRAIQNDLSRGVSLPIVDQVSVLTKEIRKLRDTMKNMPSMPSGGSFSVGKYATGGEIPGHSTSGDKVPIMVNSGEFVLNKAQMAKVGKIMGGKSPKQAFRAIAGRSNIGGSYKNGRQAFATGGFVENVLPNYIHHLNSSSGPSDSESKNIANKLNRLLSIIRDNSISNADVDRLIIHAGYGTPAALRGMTSQQIDALINAFGRIKRDSVTSTPPPDVNSDTPEARMFNAGATIMKNLASNATGATRTDLRSRMREAGSIGRQTNRIMKHGTNDDKARVRALNEKFNVHSAEDVAGMSAQDLEEYNAQLQEIEDHVDAIENEVSELSGEMDETSRIITKLFKDWGAGNVVVAAGIILIAQKVKEVADGIQKWIGEIVQLNIETQRLQQNMNALGGSVNMDAMRDGLNLTRKEAIALGEAYKTIGLNAMNSMENVSVIAANLKNALGQVDISMLKEAVNVIKDLPNQQVEVLLTGTGSLDDKASLLTNLMKDGKLESTIDLMANGAFGDREGSIQLSPKDKALVETQNKTNKILEDIKFGLYDWMPEGLGKIAMWTTFGGKLVANAAQTLIIGRGIWVSTKRLATASGLGVIFVRDTGRGTGGGGGGRGSRFSRGLTGAAIGLAVGTIVGNIIKDVLVAHSEGIKKKRDYELQANAAENRRKFGHTKGNILDYYKKEREANIWKAAGTGGKWGGIIGGMIGGAAAGAAGGAWGGPVGMVGGALIGAVGGGLAGAGIGAGVGAMSDDGNPLKTDADISYYKRMVESIEKNYKVLYGSDKVEKKQLKELMLLNKYSKKMTNLLAKRTFAYQHESINADIALLKSKSMMGGSDLSYNNISNDVILKAIKLAKSESYYMDKQTADTLKNKDLGTAGQMVVINTFFQNQLKFISEFSDKMKQIIDQIFRSPEMIKKKLENEINNLKIDFLQKNFMDAPFVDIEKNYKNALDMVDLANQNYSEAMEHIKKIELPFQEVQKVAQQKMKETGYNAANESDARKTIDNYHEDLRKSGVTETAIEISEIQDMLGVAKDTAGIISLIPKAEATLEHLESEAARKGDNEGVQFYKNLKDQLKKQNEILKNPKASAEQKRQAEETIRTILQIKISAKKSEELQKMRALREKHPNIDNAKKYFAYKQLGESAGKTSENLRLEAEKNAKSNWYKGLEDATNEMRKQIEAGFNTGTMQFTRALMDALDKQKKYDYFSDSYGAAQAELEAMSAKQKENANAEANVKNTVENARVAINGEQNNDGSFKTKGLNQQYEEDVIKQLGEKKGKERLEKEATNGVKTYRNKVIERATLMMLALMEKDASKRAVLIEKIARISSEIQTMEDTNRVVQDWLKDTGSEKFRSSAAGIVGPLEKALKQQSETKNDFINQMEKISEIIRNALKDGTYVLSKTIMEAARQRGDYHKRFGSYRQAVSDSRKAIDDSSTAMDVGIEKTEQNYNLALEGAKKALNTNIENANGDMKKIQDAYKAYAVSLAAAEKTKYETLKNLMQDYIDSVSSYITTKMEKIGRFEESINIEKDLANQIGAPYEYIIELEKATVLMAREKVKVAQEELDLLKARGVEGEELEKAKLKLQRAQANEIKATVGAQRDAIDKMLGKVMGTFQEIGGIFGPNGARMMAKKYGQGHLLYESGMVGRAGSTMFNYEQRRDHMFGNPPQFATGGKIGGSSKSGDEVLALVNSGEFVLNPKQMENLKKRLGAKSQDEVFALANKDLPQYARGGKVGKKEEDNPLFKELHQKFRDAGFTSELNARRQQVDKNQYVDSNGNLKVSSAKRYGLKPSNAYNGAYEISMNDALNWKHGTRVREDLYDPDEEKRKIQSQNDILTNLKKSGVDATPGALKIVSNAQFGSTQQGESGGNEPQQSGNYIQSAARVEQPKKQDVRDAVENKLRGHFGNYKFNNKSRTSSATVSSNPALDAKPGSNCDPCVSKKLTEINSNVEKIISAVNDFESEREETTTDKNKQGYVTDIGLQTTASATQQKGNVTGQTTTDKNKQGKVVGKSQTITTDKNNQGNVAGKNQTTTTTGKDDDDRIFGADGKIISDGLPRKVNNYIKREASKHLQKPSTDDKSKKDEGVKKPPKSQKSDDKSATAPAGTPQNPDATATPNKPVIKKDEKGSKDGNVKSSGNQGDDNPVKEKSIHVRENEEALAKFLTMRKNPCKEEKSAVKIQKDILDVAREIRDILLKKYGDDSGNNNNGQRPKNPRDMEPGKLDPKEAEKIRNSQKSLHPKVVSPKLKKPEEIQKKKFESNGIIPPVLNTAGRAIASPVTFSGMAKTAWKGVQSISRGVKKVSKGVGRGIKNTLQRIKGIKKPETTDLILRDPNTPPVGKSLSGKLKDALKTIKNPKAKLEEIKNGWKKRKDAAVKSWNNRDPNARIKQPKMIDTGYGKVEAPKDWDKMSPKDQKRWKEISKKIAPETKHTPKEIESAQNKLKEIEAKYKSSETAGKPTTPVNKPNTSASDVKTPQQSAGTPKPNQGVTSSGKPAGTPTSQPQSNPVKTETTAGKPKVETPKGETPKVESPKAETPKGEGKSVRPAGTSASSAPKAKMESFKLYKGADGKGVLGPDARALSGQLVMTEKEAKVVRPVVDAVKNSKPVKATTETVSKVANVVKNSKPVKATAETLSRTADAVVGFAKGRPVTTPGAGARYLGRAAKPLGKGLQGAAYALDALETGGRALDAYANWGNMDVNDKIQNSAMIASSAMKFLSNRMGPSGLLVRGVLEGGEYVANGINEFSTDSYNAHQLSGAISAWESKNKKDKIANASISGNYLNRNEKKEDYLARIKADAAKSEGVYRQIFASTGKGKFAEANAASVKRAYDNNTTYMDWLWGDGVAQAAKGQAMDSVKNSREERALNLQRLYDLGTTGGGGLSKDDLNYLTQTLPQKTGDEYSRGFAAIKKKALEGSVKTHTETAKVQDAESKAISPEMVFSDAKMAEIERMFSTSKDGQKALASFRKRMEERRKSWDYYAEVDAELAQAQQDLLKELQSGNNSNPALTARKLKDVETRRAELHDLMKKAIPDFNADIEDLAKKAKDAADAGATTNGKNRYDVNDDGKVTEKELATVRQQELAEQEKERKAALVDAQAKYDKAKTEFEASQKDIGTTLKDYAMSSGGYVPTIGKDGKVTRMLATHDEQGKAITAEEAQKRQLYARAYMDENGKVVPITHMQDPRYRTSVKDQFKGTKSDVMVTPEQVAKTDKYFASKRKFEETGAALQDAAIHLNSTQRAIKTNNETLARLGKSEGNVVWETGGAKKQGQGQTPPQQQSAKPEEQAKAGQQQTPPEQPPKQEQAKAEQKPETPPPAQVLAAQPPKQEQQVFENAALVKATTAQIESAKSATDQLKMINANAPQNAQQQFAQIMGNFDPIKMATDPNAILKMAMPNASALFDANSGVFSGIMDSVKQEGQQAMMASVKQAEMMGGAIQQQQAALQNPASQQPVKNPNDYVAQTTPLSDEAVSVMQRLDALQSKNGSFGQQGSNAQANNTVSNQSSGNGKQQIEVTVNVKFDNAVFKDAVVRIVTGTEVAQQITNKGMMSNG